MNNEILIVDDNSDIRLLISGILKDKGFLVREAANYDQAINEINKKLRYSLMILYLFFIFSMLLAKYNTLQNNYSRIFLTLVIICAFVTNKVFINGFINLQFHIFYALALTYHLYSLINMYMKKKLNL